MLRIFIDGSISGGCKAFEALGKVTPFDGCSVKDDPELVRDANVLVTRSSTPVGEGILSCSPDLQVLASPTVGTDHVDFDALDRYRKHTGRKVPWFHAPGATSGGVADFALAAIFESVGSRPAHTGNLRVGIWGFGNCGKALASRLDHFRIPWEAYDPPLQKKTGFPIASLDTILSCNVVSLHVPLTFEDGSDWPTFHMVDGTLIGRLSARPTLLVNTSRGPVVDTTVLAKALADDTGLTACLDVWENEPTPDPDLVEACRLSTPHCAGSVLEGRERALSMVRDSVARFLRSGRNPVPAPTEHTSTGIRPAEGGLGFLDIVGLSSLSRRFKSTYLSVNPCLRGKTFHAVRAEGARHEVRWD